MSEDKDRSSAALDFSDIRKIGDGKYAYTDGRYQVEFSFSGEQKLEDVVAGYIMKKLS